VSTIKVDTVQSSGGGAVTLTQQQATKHWVNYDAVDSTVDGSFNQSSLTDHRTGDFTSIFTNNFTSGTNKCHFASAINSTSGGADRVSGETRCGVNANLGHVQSDASMSALSTSQIQFFTGFGANASEAGSEDDLSASYCMTIGDLA
jgi:hypothetical protein